MPTLVRSGPGNTRTREELVTPIEGVVTDACAGTAGVAIDRPEGRRESMAVERCCRSTAEGCFRDRAEDLRGNDREGEDGKEEEDLRGEGGGGE